MGMDYRCARPVRNKATFSYELLNKNSGFIVLTQATISSFTVY